MSSLVALPLIERSQTGKEASYSQTMCITMKMAMSSLAGKAGGVYYELGLVIRIR